MMRLNYIKIKEILNSRGIKLISSEYKNMHTKVKLKCKHGHLWYAKPGNIIYGKTGCPICSGKAPYSDKELKLIVSQKEGLILSKIPLSILSNTKIKLKCKNAHTWITRAARIRSGRWCKQCNAKKYSNIELIDVLQKLYKNLGRVPIYSDFTTPRYDTICDRFGGIQSALIAAGIEVRKITKEDCLLEIQKLSEVLGRSPTQVEYKNQGTKISLDFIKRHFGWTCLKKELGLSLHHRRWKKSEIMNVSKKYTTRAEFHKSSPAAYSAARNMGILDRVCSHMKKVGSRYKRAIYAFEFPDKSVYVGLTFNYDERYRSHLKRGPVFEKTKTLPHFFRKFNEWHHRDDAGRIEKLTIDHYKENGWKILNTVEGGGLGGGEKKWNYVAIIGAVSKCKTIGEFIKKFPGAYQAAHKKGIWKKLKNKLEDESTPKGYWTEVRIIKEAKKYKYKDDFRKNSPGARGAAQRLGILAKVQKDMKSRKPFIVKWTPASIMLSVNKCVTLSEFRKKYPGAYLRAKQTGLIIKIKKKFPDEITPGFWTEARIRDEQKKYKTRNDFLQSARGAYAAAKRLGIFDSLWKKKPKKISGRG